MILDSIYLNFNENQILNGVYLKVDTHCITGLFGLNGSGKSSLLKIGAGLVRPNSGNVFIDNQVYSPTNIINRYNFIAFLSQTSFLPKDITVGKIVSLFPIDENILKMDGVLSKVANESIADLSGGELRYLELKLIFSLNRKYYLLDEPFTGVEPKIIDLIIGELINLKRSGKGILITDHYHRYVTEVVDTSYLLKNGQCRLLTEPNDYFDLIKG